MRRVLLTVVAIVVGIVGGIVLAKRLAPVQAQAKPGFGFAAVPGEKGGQDITGPYEVVNPSLRCPDTKSGPGAR